MIVLSNSVDYQHTIWVLQVVDKETKQVTVNPFKRLTKNIIAVKLTTIVQALSNVYDLNLMWYTILSSVTDYVPQVSERYIMKLPSSTKKPTSSYDLVGFSSMRQHFLGDFLSR